MPLQPFRSGNESVQYLNENMLGAQLLKFATSSPTLDAYFYPNLIHVSLKSMRWVFSCVVNFDRSIASGTIHNFSFNGFTKDINGTLIPAFASQYIGMTAASGSINPMTTITCVCDPSMTSVNINGTASDQFALSAAGAISTFEGMYANQRDRFPLNQTYDTMTAGVTPQVLKSTIWPYAAVKDLYIAVGFTKGNTVIPGLEISNIAWRMMEI